ncbi:MAG: alpha/beta hydrolase [Ferruginibacter sp.]
MNRVLRIIGFGLALSILYSCSTQYKTFSKNNRTKIHNLSYGTHKKQKLDAYFPETIDSSRPVVVLIHGGSWKHGDKLMLRSVQHMLLRNGVPSININYRLMSKKIKLGQQQDDIASSILLADSLFKNKYSGKYILLGESAGAHLAMMYGYRNTQQVEKIISLSGPTDLSDKAYTKSFKSLLAIPVINKLTSSSYKRGQVIPEAYKTCSPLYNISNVPTLLVQGGVDFYVNKRQAYQLDSVLAERNIEHKLVYVKNGGHVARLNPIFRNKFIYPAIKEWVGIAAAKATNTN